MLAMNQDMIKQSVCSHDHYSSQTKLDILNDLAGRFDSILWMVVVIKQIEALFSICGRA